MKILIVDDETYARERLCDLLADVPRCDVVACASNGIEAIAKAQETQPHIVLLDICLPGMDGIEVARNLEQLASPPQVIFTTAHLEYALKAFSTKAFGYLLKPILCKSLMERITHAEKSNALTVREGTNHDGERQYLTCRRRNKVEVINVDKIMFLRSSSKYTLVKHVDGESVLLDTLIKLEKQYGDRFIRIHRSVLVNPDYIKLVERVHKNKVTLFVKGYREVLPVSRRHYPNVRRTLEALGRDIKIVG